MKAKRTLTQAVKAKKAKVAIETLKAIGYTIYAWDEQNGEPMPSALAERMEIEAVRHVKQALNEEALKNANCCMKVPDPVPVIAANIAKEVMYYSPLEGNSIMSIATALIELKRKEKVQHCINTMKKLESELESIRAEHTYFKETIKF